MIFVTVGSMFPYDRLIETMDAWARDSARNDVRAQIGNGTYLPRNMSYDRRLSQAEFTATMAAASLIVSHAGMGTVITASRLGKPIVLLPRIAEWGEHTSDHQIATAAWLRGKPGLFVADTSRDLAAAMQQAMEFRTRPDGERLAPFADRAFTDRIRAAMDRFLA